MRCLPLLTLVLLSACWGGGSDPQPPLPAPAAPVVDVQVALKQLVFSWSDIAGATHYRLLENADGHSGFTQVGSDIPVGTSSVILPIAVHFQDFTNALYIVQACNVTRCNNSTEVNAMNGDEAAIGYFKASNTGEFDDFSVVALSADGNTLAVGAPGEGSSATGVNGNQNDDSTLDAGAVYIFRFDGTNWAQQAYIKASNSGDFDSFGSAVVLSADGDTLAVGASGERSRATGIDGDQDDDSIVSAGAAYIFRFDGVAWSQQAYIKASNTRVPVTGWGDGFGSAVALSADGDTLAVGASGERSRATGIDGEQTQDDSNFFAGAVYVFRFNGTNWSQQAYVKASNTGEGDSFGSAVALSADGATLAVGAVLEGSSATGVGGDQTDDSTGGAGAVYVFRFVATEWSQQAYIKASNTEASDQFGDAVSLSTDGDTLAVSAELESSNATGIGGDQNDNSAEDSGAVYVFRFVATEWSQQAYIKASNTGEFDYFGSGAVALSADGNRLAVAAPGERSNATGIDGDQGDDSFFDAGAVYVFHYEGADWSQQAYVKAANTGEDKFGVAMNLSADGNTLAVGARREESNATGIGGDQSDNSLQRAGAVYLY